MKELKHWVVTAFKKNARTLGAICEELGLLDQGDSGTDGMQGISSSELGGIFFAITLQQKKILFVPK